MVCSSFNLKVTEDPRPSSFVAPSAMKRDSIRRHCNVAGVCVLKIASNVLWCFLFKRTFITIFNFTTYLLKYQLKNVSPLKEQDTIMWNRMV